MFLVADGRRHVYNRVRRPYSSIYEKDQHGFGVVFVLLAVAILVVLTRGSWWVWHYTQQASNFPTKPTAATSTTHAAYINTKYGYSVDFSAAKYHAVVWLAYQGEALSQADAISIIPVDQQLDQAGVTAYMTVQAEGTDYSQQAFRALFMPDWELTFANSIVGNSQAMLAHVVKYTGHPNLSTDEYLVQVKSGNVFSISVLHNNADAQAMLNSFVGN